MRAWSRRWLALVVLALGAGCGDDASGPTGPGTSPEPGDPPTAVLAVRALRGTPGHFVLDGTGSSASADRTLVAYRFTVTATSSSEILRDVVLTENLREPRIVLPLFARPGARRAALQAGDEPAKPQSASALSAGPGEVQATLEVTDDAGDTDTQTQTLDVGATAGSSDQDCSVLCSRADGDVRVACVLAIESGCTQVSLTTDVLAVAQNHFSDAGLTEDTPIWISACGGYGKGGESIDDGPRGGSGGFPGFALTATTITDFVSNHGTDELTYYVGRQGDSDQSPSGPGAASTFVIAGATQPADMDEANTILIAGGSGGGGEAADSHDGTDGGAGGIAVAFDGAVASGEGDRGKASGFTAMGGHGGHDGDGGGHGSCHWACGTSTDHSAGNAGQAGRGGNAGGGKDEEGAKGWLQGNPDVSNTGRGGSGGAATSTSCNTAGGGGGYGGGGSGSQCSETGSSEVQCGGGGGGGSVAAASTVIDLEVPVNGEAQCAESDGNVVVTFNPGLPRCRFASSTLPVSSSACPASVIGNNTEFIVEAWGGDGGSGAAVYGALLRPGGEGGAGGYAVSGPFPVSMLDQLYLYIGAAGADGESIEDCSLESANAGQGGAATIVTATPLPTSGDLDEYDAATRSSSPSVGDLGVLLIAGGGGGGAGGASDHPGTDIFGGAGGALQVVSGDDPAGIVCGPEQTCFQGGSPGGAGGAPNGQCNGGGGSTVLDGDQFVAADGQGSATGDDGAGHNGIGGPGGNFCPGALDTSGAVGCQSTGEGPGWLPTTSGESLPTSSFWQPGRGASTQAFGKPSAGGGYGGGGVPSGRASGDGTQPHCGAGGGGSYGTTWDSSPIWPENARIGPTKPLIFGPNGGVVVTFLTS